MKHVHKIILISALLIGGYAGISYFSQYEVCNYPLINLKQAKRAFDETKDAQALERATQRIKRYYTSSEYENDLKHVLQTALDYFASQVVTPQSLIIFDIDDTAFYDYQWLDPIKFIWEHQPKLLEARKTQINPAIKPVLNFYKAIKRLGYKTIFLSARNQGAYEEYYDNLIRLGYTDFEELILIPDKLAFDPMIRIKDWKLKMREQLEQKYTIVGNVGDRKGDFYGGYNGYKVKLPNYLY